MLKFNYKLKTLEHDVEDRFTIKEVRKLTVSDDLSAIRQQEGVVYWGLEFTVF